MGYLGVSCRVTPDLGDKIADFRVRRLKPSTSFAYARHFLDLISADFAVTDIETKTSFWCAPGVRIADFALKRIKKGAFFACPPHTFFRPRNRKFHRKASQKEHISFSLLPANAVFTCY